MGEGWSEKVPSIDYDWRGLSLKQPAASLVADGWKPVENRNPTQVKHGTVAGRWVLVHASKGQTFPSRASIAASYPVPLPEPFLSPCSLPAGQVLAVARIRGVYKKSELSIDAEAWGNEGEACILFDVMLKLNVPVAIPGSLGFWKLHLDPVRTSPARTTDRERAMSTTELAAWRAVQDAKYAHKRAARCECLRVVLQAIHDGSYSQPV